jgi:hypothetical protein
MEVSLNCAVRRGRQYWWPNTSRLYSVRHLQSDLRETTTGEAKFVAVFQTSPSASSSSGLTCLHVERHWPTGTPRSAAPWNRYSTGTLSVSESSNLSHVNNVSTPIFIYRYLTKVEDRRENKHGDRPTPASWIRRKTPPFHVIVEITRSVLCLSVF